jgi:hypothetical protein
MTNEELNLAIAIELFNQPPRVVPPNQKGWDNTLSCNSPIWEDVVKRAIEANVQLKVVDVYKGITYGVTFDGWYMYWQQEYSDSYRSSDTQVLDGEPRHWREEYNPLYVTPAPLQDYTKDMASAWEAVQACLKRDSDYRLEIKHNGTSTAAVIFKIGQPEMFHHLDGSAPVAVLSAILKAIRNTQTL